MNKTELVKAVAEKAGVQMNVAGEVVSAVVDVVADALKAGEEVVLVGFGTFKVAERAERVARNPRTGEALTIPASRVPVFKAGKGLKDAVK